MKKRKYMGLILCAVLLLTMAGCGEKPVETTEAETTTQAETTTEAVLTAAELMTLSAEAMKDVQSVSMGMDMVLKFSMTAAGASQNMDIQMGMDMDVVNEPEQMYTKMDMSMAGMNFDMEMYYVQEDGNPMTYTGMFGMWTKTAGTGETSEMDPAQMIELEKLAEENVEIEVAPDMETVNGRDAYKLSATLEGEYFAAVMGIVSDMTGSMGAGTENMDASQLSADVVWWLYADDYRIAKMDMDVNGFEDAINVEEPSVEVKTETFHISLAYKSFNDLTEIVVPEEIKSNAIDAGQAGNLELPEGLTQDELGFFLLDGVYEEDDITVKVAAPSGFTLDTENSTNQRLVLDMEGSSEEDYLYVLYTAYVMDEEFTEDEFVFYHRNAVLVMAGDSSYSNVSLSDVKTITAGDYEIKYTKLNYTYAGAVAYEEYATWVIVGNQAIACDTVETAYAGCQLVQDEEAFVTSLYKGVLFQ